MHIILFKRTFVYCLLFLSLFLTFRFLYDGMLVDFNKIYYFHIIGDSLFFALPVLFCKKKRFVYPYLLLIVFYILSIASYYHIYYTLMPLSSYLLIDNLQGLIPSICHSVYWGDLKLLVPIFLFFVYYWWLCRSDKLSVSIYSKWRIIALMIGLLLSISIISAPYWPNQRPFYKQPLYLFKYAGTSAIKKYGIVNYWIYQWISGLSVSVEEKCYARNFVEQLSKKKEVILPNVVISRNLVLILVESLQSWPVGLRVGTNDITPYINGLLDDTTTVYFSRVMSQVKDGRSSDAQLIINTGLLPLATGAASSLCATNTFPSIAFALKEKSYVSASFICDDKTYWNQGATTVAYGFDYLYDRLQGDGERKVADENLFSKSLPILKGMKQPFYAQLVTLSSHEPYVKPIMFDIPLLNENLESDEVRNYLIAVRYVDRCIADFIEGLKKEGLYDNSIIVIIGDHEQMTFNTYEGREQVKAEDCFVPFIIVNSPLTSRHTNKVCGQIDIYPSLLNLMGCFDYSWRGFGESVFSDEISDYAAFRTGISAGGINVPDSVKKYRDECWEVSDILLRMNYFNK